MSLLSTLLETSTPRLVHSRPTTSVKAWSQLQLRPQLHNFVIGLYCKRNSCCAVSFALLFIDAYYTSPELLQQNQPMQKWLVEASDRRRLLNFPGHL